MTQCTTCALRTRKPQSGIYNMRCVHCCARLIRSARPLKHAQESMFACIARHEDAPTKDAVIAEIRSMDQQAQKGGAA